MAEAVQTAIVDLAVKKLVSKGFGAINYVMDLESELKKLEYTRTLIEAALLDADSMSEQYSHTEQDTLEKVSCQLDRLVDLLDARASRELQKQVMGGSNFTKELCSFFSASNQLVARVKDARKVDDIKKKLSSIAIDHAMIGRICCVPTREKSIQRAGSSSSNILPNFVVGRDKDRDQIVSMLSEDSMASGPLSVSSIVGIGGMGKTTLAWYVYNDERMKHCFDVQFWVSTTQGFDVRKVLETIIACGSGEIMPLNLCDMAQLYHLFHQAIGGKKYLLVLDNIWDQTDLRNKWFELRKLLEFGANGSKVLITTRDQKVAGVMDSNDPYKLEDLTEDDSWLLFQNIAFAQWQEPGVKAIGKEIARMCPKVPLVIRSIGGLLAGKRTVQQWQAFKDDQLANFASYGRDIMHTLKFSYDQLDARLKLCVTYCTLFQKGGSFHTDEMIHRWIALDYVKPIYENQSLEEAGEDYMINLHNSGFLQLHCNNLTGILFRMQDVMYELVLSLAGFKYKVADSSTDEIDKRVRHLSFWKVAEIWYMKTARSYLNEYWEMPSFLVSNTKHLQSLVGGTTKISLSFSGMNLFMCAKLISRLYCLRVLDIERVMIKVLPTSVGELICLRFLNLCRTDIVKLPNSVTRLLNLQSLYLNDCEELEELPRDISKMVNLRHLKLGGSKLRHMPMGLGNLYSLRTLDVFVVGEHVESEATTVGKLADLNQLNNLSGGLSINVRRESKYIMSSEISGVNLKMKKNLQQLSIRFKYGKKEDERVLECLHPPANLRVLQITNYGGEKLPGWMRDQLESHLPNLIEIYISRCHACRYMCSFGRLPYLEYLTLTCFKELEYIDSSIYRSNANGSGYIVEELATTPLFPSLIRFTVKETPKLKGWWKMSSSSEQDSGDSHQAHRLVNWKPAFPKLNELIVNSLEMAITIARQHLGGFTSLKSLQICYDSMQQRHAPTPTLLLINCFPSLQRLYLTEMPSLDFPEEVRDLSSLQFLRVCNCTRMKAIPQWIDSLASLETLELSGCKDMESLPHQITNLPNLKKLEIIRCPIVSERCQSPSGEYWCYIKHIPHLYIPTPPQTS